MTTSSEIAQKRSQIASDSFRLGLWALLIASLLHGFGIYNRFEVRALIKLLNIVEVDLQSKPSPRPESEAVPAPASKDDAEKL